MLPTQKATHHLLGDSHILVVFFLHAKHRADSRSKLVSLKGLGDVVTATGVEAFWIRDLVWRTPI